MKQYLLITILALVLVSCTKTTLNDSIPGPIQDSNVTVKLKLEFFGSSTIAKWPNLVESFPDYNVIIKGYPGRLYTDAYYKIDTSVTAYHPDIIVLSWGENDVAGGRVSSQIIPAIQRVITRIRTQNPHTKIIYLPIKPCPNLWSKLNTIENTNAKIKVWINQQPDVYYLDTYSKLALWNPKRPNPDLFADGIHMNAKGYNIYNRDITAFLLTILKK